MKCQQETVSVLNAGLSGLQSERMSQRPDGLCQGILMNREEQTKRTEARLYYVYSVLEDKANTSSLIRQRFWLCLCLPDSCSASPLMDFMSTVVLAVVLVLPQKRYSFLFYLCFFHL